ncbi:MAG: F0F1 ATP synthase subunit B [Oceanospirillales bacterium]|nr:F0F1 ATP synthase subunit B [Oceanospirillales bacterium]
MLIDWFTVVAQLINFLILVGLMKRFLYQPILDAIDARERRIADELADAAAKCAEAERARDDFRHRSSALDQQRDTLLKAAEAEAEMRRTQLLTDAQQAADMLSQQHRDALAQEYLQFKTELSRLTRDEVFAISRKVLGDLSDTTLEARMCEVFVQRLQHLDTATRDQLISAFYASPGPVWVRSTFELPPPQRQSIQAAVDVLFATAVSVQFATNPTLINGLELSINGRKLGWNIADYLAAMDTRVSILLARHSVSEPRP